MISSNVLEKVGILDPGERFSLSYAASGGMEYHLQNRHDAFNGQWLRLPEFDAMSTVSLTAYMRYTYWPIEVSGSGRSSPGCLRTMSG